MERAPRLYRRRRERGGILLGLCAGIGAHLGYDPVLIRLVFVVLVCMHYAGLAMVLIYLLFSLFVPYEPESTAGEG